MDKYKKSENAMGKKSDSISKEWEEPKVMTFQREVVDPTWGNCSGGSEWSLHACAFTVGVDP